MKVKNKEIKREKIKYLIYFLVLLIIEVFIALFIHDEFIRPYVGDMLVVLVLYYFVRIFLPRKYKLLPLYIFIFASGIEALQYFNLVSFLGVEDNGFLSILLGSTFDVKDIASYGIGCIALGAYEKYIKK